MKNVYWMVMALSVAVAAEPLRCPTHEEADAFGTHTHPEPVLAARGMLAQADPVVRIRETEHFAIVFQESGAHGIGGALTDADRNGFPDVIDSLAVVAERVWRLGVDTMGYIPPKARDSLAGFRIRLGKPGKFPITILDIPTVSPSLGGKGYMGLATRPSADWDSAKGMQLVLDNDFLDLGKPIQAKVDPINTQLGTDSVLYDYSKDVLKGWSTTLAHEFYHNLQYEYDPFYLYAWHEMTAVWFAIRSFPNIKHHWQYYDHFIRYNSAGSFSTFESLSPYANFPLVQSLVAIHGEDAVRRLWPLHRSAFDPNEYSWFTKSLNTLGLDNGKVTAHFAAEAVKLVMNVPGTINDNGSAKVSFDFNAPFSGYIIRPVKRDGDFIYPSSHSYGALKVKLSNDQIQTGLNYLFHTALTDGSAGFGIGRLPSRDVKGYAQTVDSLVFSPTSTDTMWFVVLVSSGTPSNSGITALYATSKLPTSVGSRRKPAVPANLKRYDLKGRPVGKDHRGLVIEGSVKNHVIRVHL